MVNSPAELKDNEIYISNGCNKQSGMKYIRCITHNLW